MVSRCGESTSPDVQLAVVRALLTMTTAEHFRAHGDCLVQVILTALFHRVRTLVSEHSACLNVTRRPCSGAQSCAVHTSTLKNNGEI